MSVAAEGAPQERIRQKRSQKTYDALISTAFKLLEQREFDDISIAEISQKAGYSVGAFYSRFTSKDELFDAMVAQHVRDRTRTRERVLAETGDATLIEALIEEMVRYYWGHRRFWRAALFRSIRDPGFWEPLAKLGHELALLLIARIEDRTTRTLTHKERMNLQFAAQIALGTINNIIINRPGPTFMDENAFVDNLSRAFRLVSGYDELMAKRAPKRAAKRTPPTRP
jgi:AcrR family transcriptional regulator